MALAGLASVGRDDAENLEEPEEPKAPAESATAEERTTRDERADATRLPGRLPAPLGARAPFMATRPPTVPTAPVNIATPAARRSRRSHTIFLPGWALGSGTTRHASAGCAAGGHSPTAASSHPAPLRYSSSPYTR
ncbi:MAG TPA: hypothetical protein VII53_00575 [Solirubrobacteraceae bacterium]